MRKTRYGSGGVFYARSLALAYFGSGNLHLNLKVRLHGNKQTCVVLQVGMQIAKSLRVEAFCLNNKLGGDLLSHARSKLSLAQIRFTALFGMGRGGSKSLWPPSITGVLMRILISRYAVL